MVMNIVSTLIRNENFGSGGGSNNGESDAHPPFHQNQNSGPPGQAFVSLNFLIKLSVNDIRNYNAKSIMCHFLLFRLK